MMMTEPTKMRLKKKYRVGLRLKRMGGQNNGTTTPPKHKRRTPKHLKGKAYPGMWGTIE